MEEKNPDNILIIEKPQDDENDSMLKKMGESIVKQMDSDIETMTMVEEAEIPDTSHNEAFVEDESTNIVLLYLKKFRRKFLGMPKWLRVSSIAFVSVLLLCVVFFGTPLWRIVFSKLGAGYMSDQMNYVPVTGVEHQTPVDDIDDLTPPPEVTDEPEMTITPAPVEGDITDDPDIRNILLLGEEAMDSGGYRGRTDLMIIATLNRKTGEISLTTLMRDMLVSIPGYQDNKLNVAYQIGGVSLLYETLEYNLGIKVNNYALVGFDSFETVVDELGGVEVTLTQDEAAYLNRTNYISNIEHRNLTAGTVLLNGNQALGYCRIRDVPTAGGEYNDFGRTTRQKLLLTGIFDSMRRLGYLDAAGVASRCLSLVTTDITTEQMEEYINLVYDIGLSSSVRTYRVPVSDSFTGGYVRRMSVIIADMEKNRAELKRIMYGEAQ